jgi:hypothetical protein
MQFTNFQGRCFTLVTNYRTLHTEFSIGAGSLWRIIYCQDLIRPPPSVCSGVVGVEGQGVDTKLQQHLHQELLEDSSFFFLFFVSVEKRLETVHWRGEVAGMSSVKLGGVSNLF